MSSMRVRCLPTTWTRSAAAVGLAALSGCGSAASDASGRPPADSAAAVERARAAVGRVLAGALRVDTIWRAGDRTSVRLSREERSPDGQGRRVDEFVVQLGPGDSVAVLDAVPGAGR